MQSVTQYKNCAVPLCKSTTINTPEKLFIYIPTDEKLRRQWFKLARRSLDHISTTSSIYFCEDHFDLSNDMEHYTRYKVMGSVKRIKLRTRCLPSRFECQPDRKKRVSQLMQLLTAPTERPAAAKQHEIQIVESCFHNEVDSEQKPSTSNDCTNLHRNDQQIEQLLLQGKAIQACSFKSYRSVNSKLQEPLPNDQDLLFEETFKSNIKELDHIKEEDDHDAYTEGIQESLISDIKIEETQLLKHEYNENQQDVVTSPTEIKESNSSGKMPHKCQQCSKTFVSSSNLRKHQLIHTGEKPFICQICSTGFSQKGNLNIHTRIHTGEKPYKCQQCSKLFICYTQLRQHEVIHTGEKPFICQICLRRFRLKATLDRHSKVHTGEKLHKCQQCSKSFGTSGSLRQHEYIHTGEKPLMCQICSKRFRQKSALDRHSKGHTGEKPFICPICSTRFSQRGYLLSHTKVHTGEKQFICEICSKRFRHKGNLVSHEKGHTGVTPYSCEICSKAYSMRGRLNRHMKIHAGVKSQLVQPPPNDQDKFQETLNSNIKEPDNIKEEDSHNACTEKTQESLISDIKIEETQFLKYEYNDDQQDVVTSSTEIKESSNVGKRPYKCQQCSKLFICNARLRQHEYIHTGEKAFICQICSKRFRQKSALDRHSKVHTGEKPFICPICSTRFSLRGNLVSHTKVHTGEKPYICQICSKRFGRKGNFNVHIRIHTGVKPYSCEICSKSYTLRGHLTRHLKIHAGERRFICYFCSDCFTYKADIRRHVKFHIGER